MNLKRGFEPLEHRDMKLKRGFEPPEHRFGSTENVRARALDTKTKTNKTQTQLQSLMLKPKSKPMAGLPLSMILGREGAGNDSSLLRRGPQRGAPHFLSPSVNISPQLI